MYFYKYVSFKNIETNMNNTNNENDKIRAKILNLEKYKLELERVQAKITCEDETVYFRY